ncbi:MAG: hypothetical protein HETSPECPRED_008467 [Heterodermia speciosa]|uniref:C2H2-type domain-containing protein n=1 Tax=Heterodermia speciosa TaxID=116794 RepID=A0A8H3FXY0_9LECA|nr:MAG: hypothetical protein HETSPECPRED_008467 [Heterodermia speciosa]
MSDHMSSDRIVTETTFETPSPVEDCTKLTVDFEIVEDVEAELSEFVRLSCLGHFEEAERVFQECLCFHEDLFPVAAEYGDFLLRQEKFEKLLSFTNEKPTFAEPKETAIFELMGVVARLHLQHLQRGRISDQGWLAWVKSFWSRGLIQSSLNSLEDVDEHLLDLFLRIAVIIHVDCADLIFNSIEKQLGAFGDGWNEFNGRLEVIFRNGHFWEAQGFLGYCLAYSNLRDRKRLLSQYCHAVGSVGVSRDETIMALTYLVSTLTQLIPLSVGQRVIEDTSQEDKEASFHDHHKSLIHSAVRDGRLEDLLLLLDQGYNPVAIGYNGQTPLHLAATDGDVEIIQTLMIRGASPNIKDSIGQLPLHLAARNGHTEAVIALIRQGIPTDPLDSIGRTPLLLAAQGGHSMIVEIFLEQCSASWNLSDSMGQLPLHLAARNGHTEVVIALINQAPPLNQWDSKGRTPFHLAAQGGHSKVVKIFLEQDSAACVNDLTFEGTLRAAAQGGHVEVMKLLTIAALNVQSGDHEAYTEDADDVLNTNNDDLDNRLNIESGHIAGEGRVPVESKMSTKDKTVDDGQKSSKLHREDDDSLEYKPSKRAKTADRMRPYTCVFARYGCAARYGSKNEWKRHVSSQHLRPGIWRCDLGACVRYIKITSTLGTSSSTIPTLSRSRSPMFPLFNDFNRKDLFTQHVRRTHGPSPTAPEEERINFDSILEGIRTRCWITLHDSPPRSLCGFCLHSEGRETIFEGQSGWVERMDHVGRHLERGEKEEEEDIELKNWLMEEGLLCWDEKQKEWKIQGATNHQ